MQTQDRVSALAGGAGLEALLKAEKELSDFSKKAGKSLKRSFATAKLMRLLKQPKNIALKVIFGVALYVFFSIYCVFAGVIFLNRNFTHPVPSWVYVSLALIPVLVVFLFMFSLYLERVIFFWNWTFCFMRYEGKSQNASCPLLMVRCPSDESESGFAYASWNGLQLDVGDIVVGVYSGDGRGKTLIYLRKAGRLGFSWWDTEHHYKDNALPKSSRKILELAYRFVQHCDVFKKIHQPLAKEKKLSSRTPEEMAALASIIKDESHVEVKPVSLEELRAQFADVFLPEALKDDILRSVHKFTNGDKTAPHGMLLCGPPGTGKSLIASGIGKALGANFVSLSLSDLKKGYIGQSGEATAKAFDAAIGADGRSVLFIDECDALFHKRNLLDSDKMTEEITTVFLQKWDGIDKSGANNVLVIGATNRRQIIDDAILDRFEVKYEIPLPDADLRLRIFENELKRLDKKVKLPDDTAKTTQGLSGRDIKTIVKKLVRSNEKAESIAPEALNECVETFRREESLLPDSDASWDKLILPAATMERLQNLACILQNSEHEALKKVRSPKGILLYGPPGTGKTQIAKTFAKECGLHFIGLSTADLKGPFVGHGAQRVKSYFEQARASAPSIIFIDELDTLSCDRSGGGYDSIATEVTGQLLSELDGLKSSAKIFTMAATNVLNKVDSALKSRFPELIEIPLPDAECRKGMFEVFLKDIPLGFNLAEHVVSFAEKTEGKSGRDIYQIVDKANTKRCLLNFKQKTSSPLALSDLIF